MSKRQFLVKATDLDDFGRGLCRTEEGTIFVPSLLPNEEALVETEYKYGKLKEVKVIERKNDSPYRVKPICPYYPSCGGCQLLHLSYDEQLRYKRKKVVNLLHKFAKLDVKVDETIPSIKTTNFRNKVQKPVKKINGKLEMGFYKNSTHELIPISSCLMESKLSSLISSQVKNLLKKYRYKPYDEDTFEGEIRHVLIKTSLHYDEALVTLVSTTSDLKGLSSFARELVKINPKIKGVSLNINKRDTNVILGEKTLSVYGYTHIKDKIFNHDFLISPKSFFQTNPYQIENLYGLAIKNADLRKDDVLLDAYCGTGTIGISCAENVKRVLGVEIEKEAVKDANRNIKINKLDNVKIISGDATEFLLKTDEKFDVIVLDPPRKGTTVDFIKAVFRIKPRRVIYISCDPVSLARDLNLFKEKYKVEKVIPVDMFPNTCSVETICELVRI